MDNDNSVGVRLAECCDVFGAEPLMDRAVSLPQEEGGVFHFGFGEAPVFTARIPYAHFVEGVTEIAGGIAPQVLIGEEENLFATGSVLGAVAEGEGPLKDGASVGRGAHRTAMFAHERFECCRGVHVGDRNDLRDICGCREGLPCICDFLEVGHVGHRTARIEVGEDYGLMVAGEDVGGLGHEVHATENDVLGLRLFLGKHRKAEGVTAGIGPLHDFVALVVMAEDEQAVTESCFRRSDSIREFGRCGVCVSVTER